jgi:glycoprotein endo-alpha-1,2-mannosidase
LNADLSRGMDFNNPDIYKTFVSDFEHFAKKYFNQAEYLKIDGRPVVYIWGTWNATGRYTEAFQEAREKVAALGFDVYIVGDIIRTDHFYPDLAAAYDANTNFVFFTPGSRATAKDVEEAATSLDGILTQWEKNIAGLNVHGREEKVILQPGFAPQYDDRLFREVNKMSSPTYIPASSKEQGIEMAMVVRQHAQPVGSQGLKLIWLNTWNNWPETTTFEPTVASGPKYPAGNYGFDMLEVIREVFGLKTFSN